MVEECHHNRNIVDHAMIIRTKTDVPTRKRRSVIDLLLAGRPGENQIKKTLRMNRKLSPTVPKTAGAKRLP
jgi:hypothetical protein